MDHTKNTISIFDRHAQLYDDKYGNVDSYAVGLDLFCGSVVPNGSVLELACGPGNVTRYIHRKRQDLQILATDLAPNMIALAQAHNPKVRFEIMDCRDLSKRTERYDAVLSAFCLPYLSKAEAIRFITDSAKRLHNGGIIYLSTMEGLYSQSRFETGSTGDQIFVHYHESGYLTQGLEANGFTIFHRERISYQTGESATTDLILIAKAQ